MLPALVISVLFILFGAGIRRYQRIQEPDKGAYPALASESAPPLKTKSKIRGENPIEAVRTAYKTLQLAHELDLSETEKAAARDNVELAIRQWKMESKIR